MATQTEKQKRPMASFEMDADVERILARVRSGGVTLVHFMNEAARRLGAEKGYARKKDIAAP